MITTDHFKVINDYSTTIKVINLKLWMINLELNEITLRWYVYIGLFQ